MNLIWWLAGDPTSHMCRPQPATRSSPNRLLISSLILDFSKYEPNCVLILMNVTRTAYYTSDYLQNKHDCQRQTERRPRSMASTLNRKLLRSPPPYRELIATEYGAADETGSHDDLREQMTPAQLHNLTKQDWGNIEYRAAYHQLAAENAGMRRGGMTRESFMDNVHSPHKVYEPSLPKEYEGYYIDQKKRQDEAVEITPALYTHKTFQRVFDDDEKPRLSPMDVVFQDKEDLELSQKLSAPPKRLYKNVQRKLGRDNYVNYDYFTELQREKKGPKKTIHSLNNPSRDLTDGLVETRPKKSNFFSRMKGKFADEQKEEKGVFTDHVDDDDSTDEELEAWMAEQPGSSNALNPTFRKQMKRKWRKAKRSLEENYFENYKKELGARELKKKDSVPSVAATEGAPVANFGPLWSNILSWVVYTPSQEAESGKIEEISEPEPEESRPKKLRHKILQGFSRPASLHSKDEWSSNSRELVRAKDDTSLYEVGMNDSEGREDLYFNEETCALEPYQKKLVVGDRSAPIQIVSHINSLIKSVLIMKVIFSPIDIIAEQIPGLQSTVIVLELIIFVWILYEVSLLIDAVCMAVRAVCAPMIAIGKFMNRVV